MKCLNCKKSVKVSEHHFIVKEYKNKKVVSTKCVHKSCQEDWEKVNLTTEKDREVLQKTAQIAQRFLGGGIANKWQM